MRREDSPQTLHAYLRRPSAAPRAELDDLDVRVVGGLSSALVSGRFECTAQRRATIWLHVLIIGVRARSGCADNGPRRQRSLPRLSPGPAKCLSDLRWECAAAPGPLAPTVCARLLYACGRALRARQPGHCLGCRRIPRWPQSWPRNAAATGRFRRRPGPEELRGRILMSPACRLEPALVSLYLGPPRAPKLRSVLRNHSFRRCHDVHYRAGNNNNCG